jgi:hypothetical protein
MLALVLVACIGIGTTLGMNISGTSGKVGASMSRSSPRGRGTRCVAIAASAPQIQITVSDRRKDSMVVLQDPSVVGAPYHVRSYS